MQSDVALRINSLIGQLWKEILTECNTLRGSLKNNMNQKIFICDFLKGYMPIVPV